MLGIIILNYKNYKKTIDCINSIMASTTIDYMIYLIDNNSSNESAIELKKMYTDSITIKIIISDVNHGYARGNNLGIQEAINDGCDSVLISNNDIIYGKSSIDSLYTKLKEEPNYIIIGPKVRNVNGSIQISFKQEKVSFYRYIFTESYLNKFSKAYKKVLHNSDYTNFHQVYWISGCCFIADLKKLNSINNFDPYTFLYFEEYILSEKATKQNYKIGYFPQVEVIHYHGEAVASGIEGGSAFNYKVRSENLRSEMYFLKSYWKYGMIKLSIIKFIRKAEMYHTFRHAINKKEALSYYSKLSKLYSKVSYIDSQKAMLNSKNY